jgi:Kef-type K+ transport system membrane component KefB
MKSEVTAPAAPEATPSNGTLLAGARPLASLAFYGGMIGVGLAVFWFVRATGETLVAPHVEAATSTAAAAHPVALAHVLVSMAVVVLGARGSGLAFERWLGQPAVMGEIVAGLLLGPSVLGALLPEVQAFVLAPDAAPHLGIIAKIGVVLFMFLVGLELDPKLLRGSTHATVAISHASIIVPFVLGTALATYLYPRYSNDQISFTTFALFTGVATSVTAFPVLARILTDRRVSATPLGVTALACAAVDDVTAWCLLAVVSGVATSQLNGAAHTIGFVALYVAAVFLIARPLVKRLADAEEKRTGPVSLGVLAIVFAALLLSAAITESIGIHALFGAFLLGAVMPHDGRLAEQVRARLEDVVVVLLVPIFFAFTGMRTQIGLVHSTADVLTCLAIIGVATLGKFGGTLVAARFAKMGWRESSALGILMNTRGLMELIVLNVGLDMGVLSPTLFTMFVLMAVVTTFATTPIFAAITKGMPALQPSSPGTAPATS